MNRNTIILTASIACLVGADSAMGQNLRVLESRVSSVESRLAAIENELFLKKNPGFTETEEAVAKPRNETYIISDGDSVGGIARKFGVPRQALLEANNMAEGQPIYIGETLVIPTSPAIIHHDREVAATIHVVRPGDTLTGISRQYGTSIASIKQANGLRSDIIGTGQHLTIPDANSGIPHPDIHSAQTEQTVEVSKGGKYHYDNPLLDRNETYGFYAVQKGDNLFALARDFFTTMRELQRLNELGNSTVIQSGDELIVPTSKYNDYHSNVAQN